MKSVKFTSHRNDMHAIIGECDCLAFPGNKLLSQYRKGFEVWGYADNNFFDKVNAEPHEVGCSKCGAKFLIQWRRDGVLSERIKQEDDPCHPN